MTVQKSMPKNRTFPEVCNYRKKGNDIYHYFNIDEQNALISFAASASIAILNERRNEDKELSKMISTGLYYRIKEEAIELLKSDAFINNFNSFSCHAYVLSIDIRRSTELMLKAIDAKAFVRFIENLEKQMANTIRNNFGIIDKFTGDGILAYSPSFYSGEYAGFRCLVSAFECHNIFDKIFSKCKDCFQVVLKNAGLGIGIDFGTINLNIRDNSELTPMATLKSPTCGRVKIPQRQNDKFNLIFANRQSFSLFHPFFSIFFLESLLAASFSR
jgi:hypothetical protein